MSEKFTVVEIRYWLETDDDGNESAWAEWEWDSSDKCDGRICAVGHIGINPLASMVVHVAVRIGTQSISTNSGELARSKSIPDELRFGTENGYKHFYDAFKVFKARIKEPVLVMPPSSKEYNGICPMCQAPAYIGTFFGSVDCSQCGGRK